MRFYEILQIISEKTNDFEHFYLYFSCFDLKQYNKYEICKRLIILLLTKNTNKKFYKFFLKHKKHILH